MKAKKYIKSTASFVAVKKYFNIKVIASLVASLMLLYTPVALYNYTKENGTLLYNVAEAQITSTVPIVKGEIKTEAKVEETSSYDVGNGFEEAEKSGSLNYTGDNTSVQNDRPSSTPTYNNQMNTNQSSDTQQNTNNTTNQVVKDLSFLKGTSITIIQGESFNPIINLGIVAHDKDGMDITNRVSIDENTVDINNDGSYYVKASVKLNDGSILEKVFTVKVNPKKEVTYEVDNFEMLENNAPKLGIARIFFDSKVSDNNISPVKATVNGVEYNINTFGKSSFGGTTRHYIDVNVGDISGEFKLNVEKIEFSNGVSVWPNKQMNLYVIKSEPVISNFSYIEGEKGKISTTFDLKDLDNSLSNIKVSLYNEKGILVEEYKVAKKEKYNLDFNVEANGEYTLEVIGDVNLYSDLSRLNQNRVILSEKINISKIVDNSEIIQQNPNVEDSIIDSSKLETNDFVELSVGEELDTNKLKQDLKIKALDKNGNDITDKVIVDTSKVDINTPGEYEATLSVINDDKTKLEKNIKIKVVSKDKIKEFSLKKNRASEIVPYSNTENTQELCVKQDSRAIVSGSESSNISQNVQLIGTVSNKAGAAPAGRIEVELPTQMSFVVNQDGNINSGTYSINNKSSFPVEVYITEFTETYRNGGITVKDTDILTTDSRDNVNLFITGNLNKPIKVYTGMSEAKVAEVGSVAESTITLSGIAGKVENENVDKNGVDEKFTVRFRINKKTI